MDISVHEGCDPVRGLSPDDHVFVSKRVFRGRPVMRVHLDEDGDWQAFSSAEPRWFGRPRLLHAAHLLERDPSLASLPALPLGHLATRGEASGTTWQIFQEWRSKTEPKPDRSSGAAFRAYSKGSSASMTA
ncbi:MULTISPECIES: hypothetical protein [unclassified Streptomyces]|uniref:hypothetical protein n=1 Tax=Streptomyces TaxID=1883 RepID=UPI00131CD180|nr:MULTISPECIES: hypothetical protein [unclassified Streptomyces]